MKKYTKKFKEENAFFINRLTGRFQINEKCKKCKNKCKQSCNAIILNCDFKKK